MELAIRSSLKLTRSLGSSTGAITHPLGYKFGFWWDLSYPSISPEGFYDLLKLFLKLVIVVFPTREVRCQSAKISSFFPRLPFPLEHVPIEIDGDEGKKPLAPNLHQLLFFR